MTPGFLCAECRVVADLRSTGTPHQRGFLFLGMTGSGRHQLYAVTGVEVPVLASKQLFTRFDFQRNEGLKTARSGHQTIANFSEFSDI